MKDRTASTTPGSLTGISGPLLLAFLAAALVCSCGGEDDIGTLGPYLVISPVMLRIYDSAPQGTFYLATVPEGELSWVVSDKPAWLDVAPSSGTISAEIVEVSVWADTTGLPPDDHQGIVGFLTTNGLVEVTVIFSIAGHPWAVVSVDSLVFAPSVSTTGFTLRNTGSGLLTWVALRSDDWLSISPNTGDVGIGGTGDVTVAADRTGLDPGDHLGAVTVLSNSAGGDIEIPVRLSVAGKAGE